MKARNFQRATLLFQTLLLCTFLNAQVITPTYLGENDGVASPFVNAVMQDSYGFLWVATANGLQKYNGFEFQNYRHHRGDTTSLQNNHCLNVMEDSNHNIWVSTNLGVSRLDRKTNLFKNYNFTIPENLGSGRVQLVFEDSQKVLWATGLTGHKVMRYDELKNKWKYVNFQYEDDNESKFIDNWSLGIAEDEQGRLWTPLEFRGLFVRNPGDSIFKNVNLSMDLPVDFAKKEHTIFNLFVDSRNELWITTQSEICQLNLETGAFKTLITYPYVDYETLVSWNCMREDKNGSIWASNNSRGLFRVDKGSDLVEVIEIEEVGKVNKTYWDLSLRNFCIDKSGIFWFGTYGRSIMKYDPIEKPFTTYTTQAGVPGTISGNNIWSLYASERNASKIYVGVGGAGFDVFDEKTKQFTNIPIQGAGDEFGGAASSIVETNEGALLVGTWGGGIVELNENYKEVNHIVYESKRNGLIDNNVRVLKKAKDGEIWIGTSNGLTRWNRKTNSFKSFESLNKRHYRPTFTDSVFNKLSLPDTISILKVGNNAAISRPFEVKEHSDYLIVTMCESDYRVATMVVGEFSTLLADYGWIANETGDTVWTAVDFKKTFWAGGALKNRLRIDVVPLVAGEYTLHYNSDNSHSYGAYNQAPPENSKWWGITVAPTDDKSIKNSLNEVSTQSVESNFLSDAGIMAIELTDSAAWIGTASGGLNHINLKTSEVTFYRTDLYDENTLSNNAIRSLCFDPEGFLWIGTTDGLNKFDIKSKVFTIYTEESGLANNSIAAIVNGDNGDMWISTREGLSRMVSYPSVNKVNFINYFKSDGLLSDNFFNRHGLRSKSGTYYFASDYGVNTFQTISGNQTAPDIVLSDFSISNLSVLSMGKNAPVTLPLASLSEMNLPHYDNDLSFEYRALEYSNPSKNQYAHKLEGFDKDWIYDNRDFASYTNLEPGDYTFRIRASNAYGVWNEEGKSISIHISSPWWHTWWAYAAYFLIFGVAIFMIDRFLSKRIADREREKNRQKELAQAKEIEKAYHNLEVAHDDLKSAQDQLVQQEKMASLGELTAGIAHEIQNPLNFVNNFSEVSNEMLDEMKEELATGNQQEAIEIADEIKQNLEKICHHGKRADLIVKGMLEHSRASTGTKEPTEINALADEYLHLAYHGLRANLGSSQRPEDKSFNATLETDFDDSIGKIDVIPQDIGRVLLNLFNNAFYAVAERAGNSKDLPGLEAYKPTVSLSTKKVNDTIEIRVSDNGNGIPKQILDKIFQPFFTTKPTGQGTGLGLSLSYDIVKAHGGELTLKSESGSTVFCLQLPIQNSLT